MRTFKSFFIPPGSNLEIKGLKENITVTVLPEKAAEPGSTTASRFAHWPRLNKVAGLIPRLLEKEKKRKSNVQIIYIYTLNGTVPFNHGQDEEGNITIERNPGVEAYHCTVTIPPNIHLDVASNGNINFTSPRGNIIAHGKQTFMPDYDQKKKKWVKAENVVVPATYTIDDGENIDGEARIMPQISLKTSNGIICITALRK